MAALLHVFTLADDALAEPVIDRALSDVDVISKKSCSVVRIGFNFRVRYVSHFPVNHGRELRIRVRPVDPTLSPALFLVKREALRAPSNKRAAMRSIEFQTRQAEGPILSIQFKHPVSYRVAQGSDFQSIIIAVSGKKSSKSCKPVFPRKTVGGTWTTTISPGKKSASRDAGRIARLPNNRRPAGTISDANLRIAAASIDEARAAIKKKKYGEAIKLLSKVLKYPENQYSPEAQEYLGLARKRNGQMSLARAEYHDYLKHYGKTDDAVRVRQRLAAITPRRPNAARSSQPWRKTKSGEKSAPEGSNWSVSGSASQFYTRDDSFRKLKDPSLPPDFNDDDDHRVYQNEILSGFDITASWSNAWIKNKFRFSGTHEHGFEPTDDDIFGVAALYGETIIKDWHLETRIGRQTRNTGGVLGRFDGGLVSWQATPKLRLNAVGGSPVNSRREGPFENDSFFYGASADFGPFFDGLDASIFAIEQQTEGYLDRRAIGFEARYFDADKSAFLTTDYDIHYNELNTAIINGTWTLPDKSTFTAALDYRKSPNLFTYNALQGQFAASLEELHLTFSKSEIERFALDRTAVAKSATLGFSRPINSRFQIGLDATVANISGTKASAGIAATPSTGNEYYYAAQLIANDLLTKGDISVIGLRYAAREASDTYVLDLNTRYPLSQELLINPRLRFSYQTSDISDLTDFAVTPSTVINYYLTKNLSLEFEAGAKFSTREQDTLTDEETELFFTFGYRYDFYADGQSNQ